MHNINEAGSVLGAIPYDSIWVIILYFMKYENDMHAPTSHLDYLAFELYIKIKISRTSLNNLMNF